MSSFFHLVEFVFMNVEQLCVFDFGVWIRFRYDFRRCLVRTLMEYLACFDFVLVILYIGQLSCSGFSSFAELIS